MQKDNKTNPKIRKVDFYNIVIFVLFLAAIILFQFGQVGMLMHRVDSQCTYIHNLTDLTNRESVLINYAYNTTIQPIPYYCGG